MRKVPQARAIPASPARPKPLGLRGVYRQRTVKTLAGGEGSGIMGPCLSKALSHLSNPDSKT